MATHFPRMFPVEQIENIAEGLKGNTPAEKWIDNLRDAAYAQGTLLTHCRELCKRVTPESVNGVRSMTDEELADAVLEELHEPRKRQGLLRGMVTGGFFSPELLAMILELLARYFLQHFSAMPTLVGATMVTDPVPIMDATEPETGRVIDTNINNPPQ